MNSETGNDPGSAADLIRALEDERYAAMIAGDVEALGRLLSDRLLYRHSAGGRDSKASYLERVRNGTFVYESIEHPEEKIIVADGAVVVLGQMIARVHRAGELHELRNQSCAVWAREDGHWRLVAFQPTPIPA